MPLEFYYALLALCSAFALLRGGGPERIAAAVIAAGSVATLFVAWGSASHYRSPEIGIFIVDLVCLGAFLALALRAERYWPLWLTGLQIIGTSAHALKLAYPEVIVRAYAFAMAFWSYPMLALIAIGTWRHQRRLALYGADRSWSSFSGRSGRGATGRPSG